MGRLDLGISREFSRCSATLLAPSAGQPTSPPERQGPSAPAEASGGNLPALCKTGY